MLKALPLVALLAAGACAPTWRSTAVGAPPKVVMVEKPCHLQPLKMPRAITADCGKDKSGWLCYNKENAGLLEKRIEAMRSWIAAARRKCGVMEYEQHAYKLLPPYRRGSGLLIPGARLRLSAGLH